MKVVIKVKVVNKRVNMLNILLQETFRANSEYELVESGSLNYPEQFALDSLVTNEEVFGVFKPKQASFYNNFKVAYKDVALLFYFLQQPSLLPYFIRNRYDDDINNTLAKLVLEEVLELKVDDTFVTGISASKHLFKNFSNPDSSNTSHISGLSEKAIRYVWQLHNLDARSIASRLYCYNTMPVLKAQYDFLQTSKDIMEFLCDGDRRLLDRIIDKSWQQHDSKEARYWLSWFRVQQNRLFNSGMEYTYKMYISPVIASMPDTFARSVAVLSNTRAFSFKVGASRQGLLRPDKFVVYFYSYTDLLEAAQLLKAELTGIPSQGVPFTAQLDEQGLLSWGIDPPREELLQDIEGASWRMQVTEKLAAAISHIRSEETAYEDALDYIRKRITLEGINPFMWTPAGENQN